jgi:3-hydroxyisobutyrate dehydrogenase-like beta-hydroxyacid dehydrogenase
MAKVGFVGIGAMGEAMAGHVLARDRDQVFVFDVRKEASAPLAAKGAKVVADLAEMSRCAEIIIVMVVNDAQVIEVSRALSAGGRQGVLVAIAATVRPTTMLDVEKIVGAAGMRVIDAPVCWGLHGAREGKLASLCGGAAEDVEKARPVLEAYSRSVHHIGPLGKGQLAKAINNMLHWAHNVTNYEALLLAKRHGLDAQALREVLLQCPAGNRTLEHWDKTLFTWPQKDMEIVQELARQGDLVLPLFGQVDQLIRLFTPKAVKDLLHGESAPYLGRTFSAMEKSD